ncbi:MAG: c-type cytochrome [Paracoccaceae bacterium]
MMRLLRILIALALIGGVAGWLLSAPRPLPASTFDGLTGDAENGALVFAAAGCRSCHVAPDDKSDGPPVLSGGYRIESPFGTFASPNISPSDAGIGGWSTADLGNALIAGVSPDGAHYFPALPYTTYQRMEPQDVVDLKAYMDTLPPSDVASLPHEVGFPFNIRRGLGLWKQINMSPDWVTELSGDELQRGRYLVEALGHCAECHTPRDATGGLDLTQWMMGAPNPSGMGTIPPLHPSKLDWSAGDIAYYLESGFTPDYDSAGGQMVSVIRGTSALPASDREAIAAYLKSLP